MNLFRIYTVLWSNYTLIEYLIFSIPSGPSGKVISLVLLSDDQPPTYGPAALLESRARV